ncbi:MAG TPA: IclR family transcriptional regulator C-terminal domain-containing protein [Burkholderiaceae bacterium]|nr:IclR family transcriptional regulator C-terminal domain-containing protein [Burkholderiaceae bacterium]
MVITAGACDTAAVAQQRSTPRRATPIDPQDLVAGLGRGLAVIECFDARHPRLTPTDVALRTGISRSAARRYLLSLCHFGYAQTDGRAFWLQARALRLGQSYLESTRLPTLAQPVLRRMAAASGETASLAVLDGHDVVYLARRGGTRTEFGLGSRVAAHAVSVGRAALSTLPDGALDDWIAEHRFTAFTACTERDPDAFRRSILEARALGYAVAEQQLELGWRGLAIAVHDRRDACVAALSVTMPVCRLGMSAMVLRYLPLLREAAGELRGFL